MTNNQTDFSLFTSGMGMAEVKEQLPESLRRLLAPHDDPNEFFTALFMNIVISGGVMPEISTSYARRRVYSTLMLFVVCPPAGGKGVISLGSKLLERINRHLMDEHTAAMNRYQRKMDQYQIALKSGDLNMRPVKPQRAQLLVPGNITGPKLIQQLGDNKSMPLVMVESEADTLSVMFKSEHGRLMSTMLRQAAHHEPISSSRKTNDETIAIENPKAIVVMAGTDNQILSIFQGNQDGLYSRFLFLRNVNSMAWRSTKPDANVRPLDDHYREWSEWFYQVWQQTQHWQAEVSFTDQQWDLLNEFGQQQQATAHLKGGEYALSIARRHALMVIRMAMTLSFLRHIEPDTAHIDTAVTGWHCADVDFELALTLGGISFQKSLELFVSMPQHPAVQIGNTKRMAFFNALPKEFDMKIANAIAHGQGVKERTKTRWISDFCDTGMLEHIDRGTYKKTAVADVAEMSLTQAISS